jgi:hypothetical protein
VATGTTRYLDRGVPFVWDSALWFVALVAAATAATAELRLRLGPPRELPDRRAPADGVTAVAGVLGIYAVTALVHAQPLGPATILVACLAALLWASLGADPAAAICGAVAAVAGTGTEIALSAAGVFEYGERFDGLLGVAPWLPFLYFGFGAAAARLGELAA